MQKKSPLERDFCARTRGDIFWSAPLLRRFSRAAKETVTAKDVRAWALIAPSGRDTAFSF